ARGVGRRARPRRRRRQARRRALAQRAAAAAGRGRPAGRASAAGVGAGRRVALDAFRQLGGLERGAVQQVALAGLEPVEPVAVEYLANDDGAADDYRRALPLEAGQLAALREWEGGEPFELPLDGFAREAVAVDAFRVVAAELERREGRDRPGDADRAARLERRQ